MNINIVWVDHTGIKLLSRLLHPFCVVFSTFAIYCLGRPSPDGYVMCDLIMTASFLF